MGEDGHFLCEDVVFGGESWYYFVGGDVICWGENCSSEKGMSYLGKGSAIVGEKV